jgi:hypothetical protein
MRILHALELPKQKLVSRDQAPMRTSASLTPPASHEPLSGKEGWARRDEWRIGARFDPSAGSSTGAGSSKGHGERRRREQAPPSSVVGDDAPAASAPPEDCGGAAFGIASETNVGKDLSKQKHQGGERKQQVEKPPTGKRGRKATAASEGASPIGSSSINPLRRSQPSVGGEIGEGEKKRGSLRSLFLGGASAAPFALGATLSSVLPEALPGESDVGHADDGSTFKFGAHIFGTSANGATEGPHNNQADALIAAADPFSEESTAMPASVMSMEPSSQAFMRKQSAEDVRGAWVRGQRDARAAYKKRHKDAARQQRLHARRSTPAGGGGTIG